TLKNFNHSLQINLINYFLYTHKFSQLIIHNNIKKQIIQINSKSNKINNKHNSNYNTTKFNNIKLTQSLTLNLTKYNITIH
ncbi:SDR family NAD(P)-dependent oxidoreductase, partial [Bacillus thuringiensis]|nr:SDR family NAD(P)-dependent oxidoreductase [Bacillus thuringiensis]